MTVISDDVEKGIVDTILSRQLRLLKSEGIRQIIITTGMFRDVLEQYCESLNLDLDFTFVNNPIYNKTNYIYSIYLAREELNDDIILMHGDIVFERGVLRSALLCQRSCMAVSTTLPLPEKDFKAQISQDGYIKSVSVDIFDDAVEAQALYKLYNEDWKIWENSIAHFCENGQRDCYAENALNIVSEKCKIYPLDVKNSLCSEIDNPEDLMNVKRALKKLLEEKQND